MRFIVVIAFVVAACASAAPPTAAPTPTRERLVDITAVKASFVEECKDPIVVDELFCKQVKIAEMTSDGDILTVPTTLSAAAQGRANAICEQVARARHSSDGMSLEYVYIGVLDMNGGNSAACSVD